MADLTLPSQVTTAAWYKALKRCAIDDFRWHDLRHTWASWHVQSGTPLNVLQELGGAGKVRKWLGAMLISRHPIWLFLPIGYLHF